MRSQCGFKHKRPGYLYATDDNDAFQAICVTRGELIVTVSDVDYPIRPDGAVLLPLGTSFSMRCDRHAYRGVTVNIWDTTDPYYRGDVAVLPAATEITHMAAEIEQELLHPGPGSERVLRHMGLLFADRFIRLAHQHGYPIAQDPGPSYRVERARRCIEAQAYSDLNVREMLREVGVSYRHLSRDFRAETGLTPKQYQITCRIERAKRLLEGTPFTMTEIAMELGYPSSQHFSAQFLDRVGLSPSAYRHNHRFSPTT